jgi:hypothetical protein
VPAFWQDIVAFKKQDSLQLPQEQSILFVGSSSLEQVFDLFVLVT